MVARKFVVRHNDSSFDVDYDTDDGIEVFKFQLFSLTAVLPGEQKIIGGKDGCVLSEDSDLISISDQLRLVSIGEEVNTEGRSSGQQSESLKSDEEFARMLQAEEEALLLQQAVASDHWGEMEKRLRPYVDQVLMYEDLNRQVAALKTVPVDDLKEKALVSLAKVQGPVLTS